MAAGGNYPSTRNWLGDQLQLRNKIRGLEWVKGAIVIGARGKNDKQITEERLSTKALKRIKEILKRRPKSLIGLRATIGKSGERFLSLEAVAWIAGLFPRNVLPIFDDAQGRAGEEEIRWALENNFLVFVGGHKFYGGPQTEAKIFMGYDRAKQLSAIIKSRKEKVAEGLKEFFTSFDLREVLEILKPGESNSLSSLTNIPNISQLIKCLVVLPEIEEFYRTDIEIRKSALIEVAKTMTAILEEEGLVVLENKTGNHFKWSTETGTQAPLPRTNPTISFAVPIKNKKREKSFLTKRELKKLFWLLNHDLNGIINGVTERENIVLGKLCLLGQAVDGKPSFLRLAPGIEWFLKIFREFFRWEKENPEAKGEKKFKKIKEIAALKIKPPTKIVTEKIKILMKHRQQWEKLKEKALGKMKDKNCNGIK